MSVQSEIDRIITAVGNAYSKVSEKGGTVPASQTVANLATAIDSIPSGGGGTPSLQSKSVTYTSNGTATITPDAGYDGLSSVDVTVNVASSTASANIVTFEYTPTERTHNISHNVLIGAGIDTVDKFLKIIGISILPKNGDVDWFHVSYGGTLNATSAIQNLTHDYGPEGSNGMLAFYNAPNYGIPHMIALQTSGDYDNNGVNKPFIVTLLLSE